MYFYSYAQNLEDIILWRTFKNIKNGFYIDLCADDAEVDSVSMGFYMQGWQGILQAVSERADQIKLSRPKDTIIKINFNTFDAAENSKSCLTPSSIDALLDSAPEQIVHWLRIDFLNLKNNILLTWKNSIVRPWVILVNYAPPHNHDLISPEFEAELIKKGYTFVFFDGVNRFYLAQEHLELQALLQKPPSLLDDVLISGKARASYYGVTEILMQRSEVLISQAKINVWQAELAVRQANIKVWQAEFRVEQALAKAAANDFRATDMQHRINGIYASRSWRLTAPLRWVVAQQKLLKKIQLFKRLGQFALNVNKYLMHATASFPWLHNLFVKLLEKPISYLNKAQNLTDANVELEQSKANGFKDLTGLSSRGKLIFNYLQNTNQHQQKGNN